MSHAKYALVVGIAALVALGDVAEAVIGRPLTPMSYAGVARRTTRRAAYAGAYAGAYNATTYAPPVAPTSTVVTTLPDGCTQVDSGSTTVYQCGGASYSPSYNGTTVVYQSN